MKHLLTTTALVASLATTGWAATETDDQQGNAAAMPLADEQQDAAQSEGMTDADEQQDVARSEDMTDADEKQDAAQSEDMPLADEQQAETELAPEAEDAEDAAEAGSVITDNNDPDELNTMSEVAEDNNAPLFGEGYARAEADTLTAEELTGARVYDSRGEWIGEIDRLHLNDDGKIAAAIVDVGGFLGIGEKPVSLDMSELDIMHSAEAGDFRVSVNYSEEELENMPTWND